MTTVLSIFFAAFCAFIFNSVHVRITNKMQKREKAVESVEKFCDELLDMAIEYWSADNSPENNDRMSILSQKISAYNMLIALFIKDNFLQTDDLRSIVKAMTNELTSDQFAENTKKASKKRVAESVGAIVELRMAIRKSKYVGNPKNDLL